ncbi:unnamed protein product [Cuscuta europaea]|uniref:Leucine-rich repeat-containing N-terminal plant-type domain-containing protein n=1 Tax=Cuscuta europaea TaxID=41803 RepID=A0A9P0ZWN7_CUSEU|nr:unnamed protein product [Cuscuta europaea]
MMMEGKKWQRRNVGRRFLSDHVTAAGSLLLLFAAAFADGTAGQSLHVLEHIVMMQLKGSITFPSTEKDTWTEPNPCDWLRVTCAPTTTDPNYKFVTSIDISSSNINGTLPGSLGVLSQLLGFGAANNRLTGQLPDFANCSNLGMLDVSHNGFTSIPQTLFRNKPALWSVTLDYNLLLQPWEIPQDLSSSSSLFSFTAADCNIHGGLPSFFSNNTFPNLVHLQLANNSLTGPVPESLAGISSLREVDLSNNHLTGSVPVFKQTNARVLTCGNSGLGDKGLPC